MAAYKDIRKSYLRDIVTHGKAQEYGSVPESLRSKWERKFFAPIFPRLSACPRLINRFSLGADPECIFVGRRRFDPDDDRPQTFRIDAIRQGLKTGQAFGADQNGRLIEFRPKPDRFALRVLASMWTELKWMALLLPDTLKLEWWCGAFLFDDGLGGHIHFGRKRPTRNEEVMALDQIGRLLFLLEVFPKEEWQRRQAGDARGQRYGNWGDFRPQIHGYEYRTLPSWLDDPWIAYLCLVLSKLAVYNPALVMKWKKGVCPENVRNLLAYYKALDDDAAIAYKALEHYGLPKHKGGDFKGRWGISFTEGNVVKGIEVIPGSIAPQDSEVEDLFNFLVKKEPLVAKKVEPTWSPLKIPEGFELIINRTEFLRVAGMGEVLTNLCHMNALPIEFYPSAREERGLIISRPLAKLLPEDWEKQIKKIAPTITIRTVGGDTGTHYSVGLNESWRSVRHIQITKKILTSGLFPIWKLKDITPETKKQWEERVKGVPEKSYRSQIVVAA